MNRIVVLNGVLTGKQLDKEAALHTAVTGNYFIIKDTDDRFIDFVLNLSPIISLKLPFQQEICWKTQHAEQSRFEQLLPVASTQQLNFQDLSKNMKTKATYLWTKQNGRTSFLCT